MQSSVSLLRRSVFYGLAGVSVLLAACRPESPPETPQPEAVAKASGTPADKTQVPPPLAETLAGFNRGAALLEQYRYSEAAKAFEAVVAAAPIGRRPGSTSAWHISTSKGKIARSIGSTLHAKHSTRF